MQVAEQGLPTKAIGPWFPYVATLMLFIWVVNLLGFLPLADLERQVPHRGVASRPSGSTRPPSSLSVTLALALMTLSSTHVEGIRCNGVATLPRELDPGRAEGDAAPDRAASRSSRQFMRLISLSVRLFANMLAGHMLILR